jgi:hypothetical protein
MNDSEDLMPSESKRGKMETFLIPLGVLVALIVLQVWVLPRLGFKG